jgi:hypothetical protein
MITDDLRRHVGNVVRGTLDAEVGGAFRGNVEGAVLKGT